MLSSSFLIVIFGIILSISDAEDLQKLCKGQRYGTLVPNPNDCNSFYVCQFIVQLTKCDIGLHFDRRNKVCNWPQDAGCDWVESEISSSEDKSPGQKPGNGDKYPGGSVVEPSKPLPSEEGNEETPSDNSHKPEDEETSPAENKPNSNEDKYPSGPEVDPTEEQPFPSEEENDEKPFEDLDKPEVEETKPSEEEQPPKVPEESKPDSAVTEDDFITANPQYPSMDSSNSSPSTVDDVIVDEIQTPNPPYLPSTDEDVAFDASKTPPAETQDNQDSFPPTVDDMITHTQTPFLDSSEYGESTPDLPKPNHPPQRPSPPPISEEIDQKPSEEIEASTEKSPSNEENIPKPPYIDDENEPNTDGANHSSHHWNLIASVMSVESSQNDGLINHPTVGAHSPETGLPVDVMTGYDPNNVKCLHSGFYFLPHPSNCQKYFICAYQHLHFHSCGNGVVWNHKREQCDLTGNARCYSRDAESDDSTELATPFIDDQTDKTTIKPSTRTRTSKTTKLPPTTLSHKLPICPLTRQIYMPNMDDCHKYFICIMGKPVLTSCPSGMHWDAVGEFCGEPSVVRCGHR